MDRKAMVAALLPALMLYACGRAVEPAEARVTVAIPADRASNPVPG